MPTLSEAISTAVRVQAARTGTSLGVIAATLGISRTALWKRMSNELPWSTEDFDKIADALGLADSWELIKLAEQEADTARAHAEKPES